MMRYLSICLAVLFTLLAVMPAIAQDVNQENIDAILQSQKQEREREARLKAEREKIQNEVKGLNQRLTRQVQTLSKLEDNLSKTQNHITELDTQYQNLKSDLNKDQAQLSTFLGYIQRLERRAPSPVISSPQSALKASQSALLIQSLTREFDQRSQDLKTQLGDIERIKTALITERACNKAEARIATEEKQARQKAAELAAQAQSLKQLLDAITAESAKVKPRIKPSINGGHTAALSQFTQSAGIKAFTRVKNTLIAPVIGQIKRKFGGGEQGVTLAAKSRSVVKAPYNGRVDFAGPFRDYDRVVILNVGEGYFLLLTGLGNIIVETGDKVKTGDILGALPASQGQNADIYVEIRKNGAPIDPAPWFKGF